MAGFQVANFDFGKNIVDANIKRQQIAANAATAARAQDVQMRGQDMAAQQNEARMAEQAAAREENARQFDENMADRQAARDENARQFDERTAREDRKYEDDRRDKAHAQSWDDAIKQQELDTKHAAYLEHSARLNSLLDIKAKEDEQAAHRQQAIRSDYGDAAIVAHLQGGFLTPSQVKEFNRVQIESGNMSENDAFDAISDSNPLTGEKFGDNSLHFIRYAKDKNGNIMYVNPNNPQEQLSPDKGGQPAVLFDRPLNTEFRNTVLGEYFGNVKQFGVDGNRGSGLSFEERMALAKENNTSRERTQGARIEETKRHNIATEEQQKKNEEGRNSRFDERTKFRREELEAKKANWNARVEAMKDKINKSGKSGSEIEARLKEVKSLQGTLNGGNLTSDNRASLKKRMNAIAESVGMEPLPELPDPSPEPSPNPEGGDAGKGNPPSNKGDNSGGQALDDELTKRGYKKINGKWVKAK